MKLEELLYTLGGETYVGIWDIRRIAPEHPRKYEKQPTRQTYHKVKNLPYGEISDLLRLDVMALNVVDNGLLIRVHAKDDFHEEYMLSRLAYKISEALKRVR